MLRTPRPASLLANARRAWRQSLQLRVVTITLASSGSLVLTFGLVVGGLITNGLVKAKTDSEMQVVTGGSEAARAQLDLIIHNDPQLNSRVEAVLKYPTVAGRDQD